MDEDGLVVESESEAQRFRYGRAGDNFMTTFQCNLCHFRNVQKRDPDSENALDLCAMRNIRRANMDALWSREPSTVRSNLAEVKKMCSYGEGRLGFEAEVNDDACDGTFSGTGRMWHEGGRVVDGKVVG